MIYDFLRARHPLHILGTRAGLTRNLLFELRFWNYDVRIAILEF